MRVYDPYVSKENSFIRFIWVEDSSKIYSSYTFSGKDISEKELIYDGNFDNLVFGEIKIPFEKEILFSDFSIMSPQILLEIFI